MILTGITLLLALLMLSEAQDDSSVDLCPANLPKDLTLQAFGDMCYQFILHQHHNWASANNDCGSKGGTLVTVKNTGIQHFIMSKLAELGFHGQGVWTGLTDRQTEGTFVWTSGEPLSYQFWGSEQPSHISLIKDREDCVLLKYTDSGHWHDYPCDSILFVPENYAWICEFHKLPETTTTASGK